jgi:autotransporter-associated beta strand protein
MNASLLRFLLPGGWLLLATSLAAQTWIGGTSSSWEDAANWDPAAVPEGSGVTAHFGAGGAAGDVAMSASHALGGIVFGTGAPNVTVFVGHPTDATTLTLDGAGVRNDGSERRQMWLTDPGFHFTAPVKLTFTQQAAVAGDVKLIAIGDGRSIEFRDHASAGSAFVTSYLTEFFDDASADTAEFDPFMSAEVFFHDRATAANAKLPAQYGRVVFDGSATAANATIKRADNTYPGPSVAVEFRDQSSAGNADIATTNVVFSGHATADHARLTNHGIQVYSSHGAYTGTFSTLAFRDSATAASATISTNATGSLSFTDQASAGSATIENHGTVTFSGKASFGDARLVANSGSYYGIGQYNQQAPTIPTGGVTFKDQATGGTGTIEIASAGAWLDFSGLYSGNGTTGRAPLLNNSATAITPDDAVVFTLGKLHNTAEGGTISLGATSLQLGGTNASMTISALVQDFGGAYGSANLIPLRSGGLIKVGTGTLTITNPDNNYAGATIVTQGTLHLAGGRIHDGDIGAQGRLTGTGTVRHKLDNSGIVSPGNSVGTITVTGGTYTQHPAGVLQIELASPTTYDRLVVQGPATLDGTLTISSLGGYVPVGNTRFDFLTATSVSGQFATVNAPTLGAALGAGLVYGAGGVQIQVTQKPFAGLGGDSPAASGFGGVLDAALTAATGEPHALLAGLNTLDAAPLSSALEALAPDRYSVLAANAFAAAAAGQTALDRRLAASPAGAASPRHALFFAGSYRRAEFDPVAGLPAAASRLGGGTVGGHWHNDRYDFGVALGYESGVVDLDESGSRADVESVVPQVYFRYASGNFRLLANAAFSHDEYDLQRRIVYEGFNQVATAAPSGRRTDLGVTAGYTLATGGWSFTPHLGALGSTWKLDDFTETGAGGANLGISTGSIGSFRTRLGVEAVRRPAASRFTPRLVVAWWHEWQDDRGFEASFAGSRYTAAGRKADADFVEASFSVDARLGPGTALYAAIGGAWGRNSAITSDFSAGFRWEF